MAVAKIITEGNTQIVRLPVGCHFFDCDEVEVEKIGSEVRLAPRSNDNAPLLQALLGFSDDFTDIVEKAHNSLIQQEREEL